jgi:hypothetical protein
MPQLKRKKPNTFKDMIDFKDRDSFSFAKEIIKPFGAIETVLDWSKQELASDWRWQLVEVSSERRPGRYIFYFESERDYLSFLLKWS